MRILPCVTVDVLAELDVGIAGTNLLGAKAVAEARPVLGAEARGRGSESILLDNVDRCIRRASESGDNNGNGGKDVGHFPKDFFFFCAEVTLCAFTV